MTPADADALARAAYDVADEYQDGKLPQRSADWANVRVSLRRELERRCPGFSATEYDRALQEGFNASR